MLAGVGPMVIEDLASFASAGFGIVSPHEAVVSRRGPACCRVPRPGVPLQCLALVRCNPQPISCIRARLAMASRSPFWAAHGEHSKAASRLRTTLFPGRYITPISLETACLSSPGGAGSKARRRDWFVASAGFALSMRSLGALTSAPAVTGGRWSSTLLLKLYRQAVRTERNC